MTMQTGRKLHLLDTMVVLLFLQFIFLNKLYMWGKLAFFVLIIVVSLCKRNLKMHIRFPEKVLIFYILYNLFSTFWGVARGYGYVAIRTMTVNVIWPFFFLLLSGEHIPRNKVRGLCKLFINCTLGMCIVDIALMIFGSMRMDPMLSLFKLWNRDKPRGSLWGGMPFFRIDNMFFLAFFIPFITASCVLNKKEDWTFLGIPKGKAFFIAAIAVITGICSDMGGIWLSIACCAGILFIGFGLYKNLKWLAAIAAMIGMLIPIFIWSYDNEGFTHHVVKEAESKFADDSLGDEGNIRSRQRMAMINSWLDSPIIGSGIGSPVYYQRVYTYEYTTENEEGYFVILYQCGIIGLALFVMVAYEGIKILRERKDISWFTYPFIVGMCCFLVGNAFNPYLANMSMMWILFFPYLLQARNKGTYELHDAERSYI